MTILQGLSDEPLLPLLGVEAARDRRHRNNQNGRNREDPRHRAQAEEPAGLAVQPPPPAEERQPRVAVAAAGQALPAEPPATGSRLDIRI